MERLVTMQQQTQTAAADPVPARRQRGHNPWLGIGLSLVVAILGVIALIWAVLFITKGRFLKPTFEKYASRFSERTIRVAGDFQFYFAPINIHFRAEGLTVSNPAWATRPNFFASRLIDTRIATIPLLFGDRRINWLELADGKIDAEWDKDGKRNTWTFGDPNAKGKPFELPLIRLATVSGTEVRYRDPKLQFLADIAFQTIKATDSRFGDSIRFSGDGALGQQKFTMTGALHSANDALAGGKNRFELHANAASDRLDVSGTLPGATVIEGADLSVAVRGRNLRNLFDYIGIAVPDTRAYRLTSHLTKAGGEWRFTRMKGGFGDSDLAGRMTISMPNDRLLLVATLSSNKVDIIDIGPFMGYNPTALATTGVQAAVSQTGGVPRLLPDAPLRADAISLFDARVDYKVRTIRAPHVPVSNIALTLDLDHKKLVLSPLTFDMSGGHVASDITIDARNPRVLTDYDIRLSPTPLGTLFKGFGLAEAGVNGKLKARIQLKGTGDSVRESLASSNGRVAVILPAGTFWTRNVQLAELDVGTYVTKLLNNKLKKPVEVNCGLIAFTVRDGIASADPILIDTDKNVILGTGNFSFKDESLDMAVRADGKTFSLFSAQSPIGVNGHFAAPGIKLISSQLLSRAGAGAALAVVGTPLAAVLAFVDIGDAKGAACGPVLSGARASAQRTTKGKPREDVGKGGPKPKN